MNSWIRFFLGSPKRFGFTAVGLFCLIAWVSPTLAQEALGRLVVAAQPLFGPLITLAIVLVGLKMILSPLFKRKK